jgi:FkbM family methyltransferase
LKTLIKGNLTYSKGKILSALINRINHKYASLHINKFPQLAIFSFDHIGLHINLYGRYEREFLDLVSELITKKIPNACSMSAVDIGANIGNHSVFFANYFKNVFSFEPNPITYEVLKINSKYASPKKNIQSYCLGLSDRNAELHFEVNSSNIGGSRIIQEKNKLDSNNFIEILVKRADELDALKEANIGLIKIDVEGHEINALKGAHEIIIKNKPIIIFEQHASEIYDGTSAVISYLESLGYDFYEIKKRFDFGEGFLNRFARLLLTKIFGSRLSIVQADKFKEKYYDMIVAINDA